MKAKTVHDSEVIRWLGIAHQELLALDSRHPIADKIAILLGKIRAQSKKKTEHENWDWADRRANDFVTLELHAMVASERERIRSCLAQNFRNLVTRQADEESRVRK